MFTASSCPRRPQPKRGCGPPPPSCGGSPLTARRVDSYSAIAKDYREHAALGRRRECRFFAKQPTFEKAVELAALSVTEEGKRHSHQRRIPRTVLHRAWRALDRTSLSRCQTFQGLFEQVQGAIGSIHGIGPLTVYDVATRIGSYLRLEPEEVYLHAGTRAGARELGLPTHCRTLPRRAFPREWSRLKPAEIEDCLCIYKSPLRSVRMRRKRIG